MGGLWSRDGLTTVGQLALLLSISCIFLMAATTRDTRVLLLAGVYGGILLVVGVVGFVVGRRG